MSDLTQLKLNSLIKDARKNEESIDKLFGGGFGVRISPKGKVSFQYRFRFNRKKQRLKLGEYPNISIKEARQKLADAVVKLDNGINPAETISETNQPDNVTSLVNDFMAHLEATRKRPEEAQRSFDKDIIPTIGKVKLSDLNGDITKAKRLIISRCLNPIKKRNSPVQANKTLSLLKQCFSYGVDNGYLSFNPIYDVKRHNIGGQEVPKKRSLSLEEIKTFMVWIAQNPRADFKTVACYKLLLLTGCRVGEMTLAMWDHIDFDAGIWTFPEDNTKSHKGKEKKHTVPLNEHIIAILNGLKEEYAHLESSYVFPATRNGRLGHEPVTVRSVAQFLNKKFKLEDKTKRIPVEKFTPHDLRRTVRTQLSAMGVSANVVKKIANHELDGMDKIYNQHDYFSERKKALTEWAQVLRAL
ncbi:MAG: tyrosine-type recombinase/integrase [Pseudomonadota bacterium]